MSRSHLLAGLLLILGTADLVLLNVWLVPAAWPPPSDSIADVELSTPAVLERPAEVESTTSHGHTGELVSHGVEQDDSGDGTEPLQVADVNSTSANIDVQIEQPDDIQLDPADELVVEPAEAFEPQQVAAVVSDLADTNYEPEEETESSSVEQMDDKTLAKATEAVEPQQVAAVVLDLADTGPEPGEGFESIVERVADEPLAESTEAVEPQQVATVVSDLADPGAEQEEKFEGAAEQAGSELLTVTTSAVYQQQFAEVLLDTADTKLKPEDEADSAVELIASGPTSAEEPTLAPRESGIEGHPPAEPQYQTIHHAVVQFDFDGDILRSTARDKLGESLRLASEHPDAEVQVDGHTDNRGREEYNFRLSERRAKAVAAVLEAEGIASQRIRILGYGPSRPLDERNTAAARAKNRRVEITIRSRLQ